MTIEPYSAAGFSILINGEPARTGAPTLETLLADLDLAGVRVATALNGRFVPAKERRGARLAPGDRIEIVSPRQGG